jgi:hypothetical protein
MTRDTISVTITAHDRFSEKLVGTYVNIWRVILAANTRHLMRRYRVDRVDESA